MNNNNSSNVPYHQPTSVDQIRTLWIGDLPFWADDNYLHSWFAHSAEVLSIKVIKNKITGQPEGYGFVEFNSHQVAERILQTFNGTQIPGTELTFRLNWASSGIGERRADAGPDHSIFVGDLAPDVTDYLLQETFKTNYLSVRGAKVVTDPATGRSKGYGFVKFADEIERNRAMVEMNGMYCSTRPMRISVATPKKTTMVGVQQPYVPPKAVYPVQVYTAPVQTVPVDTYGYGQGYDPYAYGGATEDPSAYAYGAYGGYPQYPQQVEGVQDMSALSGVAPAVEQREEIYDSLATPNVDKLNAAYLSVHARAILGRPLWQSTSSTSQQA